MPGSSLFLLRAGFLRRWPLHVNCSLSEPQGMQDGINLAGRRRNASNAILGASAAACHSRKERRARRVPLNATSGDTTHDDSSGQVSFVCRLVLVFVGSGAVCLWVPSGFAVSTRPNQPRGLKRKFVRPALFGVRGRCVDGSSQVPPVGTRVRDGDVFA